MNKGVEDPVAIKLWDSLYSKFVWGKVWEKKKKYYVH